MKRKEAELGAWIDEESRVVREIEWCAACCWTVGIV